MKNITLGSYVKTKTNNHCGRVKAKFGTFYSSTESDEWFNNLERVQKMDEEERKLLKEETWYSIICKGGGSILVSESDIEIVDKFELNNLWEDFYFKK